MPKLKLKNLDQSGASNGQVPKFNFTSGSWVPSSDVSGSSGGSSSPYFSESVQTHSQLIVYVTDSNVVIGTYEISQVLSESAVVQAIGWAHGSLIDGPAGLPFSYQLGASITRLNNGNLYTGSFFAAAETLGGDGGAGVVGATLSATLDTPVPGTTTISFTVNPAGYGDVNLRTVLNWVLTRVSSAI